MPRVRLASLCTVAALAASLFIAPNRVHGATLPVCDNAWHVEPHPQNGQVLRSVSARWIQGAWAVGSVYDGQRAFAWRTYIEHWNGTAWNHIASPNVDPSSSPGDNELYGVNGIGADVWAVGGYQESPDHTHAGGHFPLVMHFGGQGWSVIQDDPSLGQATLTGVWKVSPADVWAVGTSWDGSHPVSEHWDGVSWTAVPIPDPTPYDDSLVDVTASGPDDVWAVGSAAGGARTLAMHWDGEEWSRVPTVQPAESSSRLAAVTVRRDRSAYAVGASSPLFDQGSTRSLIETWNGATWSRMTSPNPAPYRNVLLGVDRGPHRLQKVWAVGYRQRSQNGPRPLIVRLGAKGWFVEKTPNPYPDGWTELGDVAVFGVPTFDSVGAVAVGNAYDPVTGDYPAVIMRRCAP